MKFMKQYGYLEKGTLDSEALYSEQAIIDAIKTVQKFGAIPETGQWDNATQKLLQSERCGVPDVIRHTSERKKRFILGSGGWKKRDITYFLANASPKMGEVPVAAELKKAFDAWSGYARLRFRPARDNNADIVIYFGSGHHGDRYPFDGPGNVLAHAFYPYEMDHYGGDVHFDDDEDWKVNTEETASGVDFFTVAVHEIGHSLGLSHSPVFSSIMFPYYKGYQSDFRLGYDDIMAMYELYISRRLEGDDVIDSSTRSSDDRNEDERNGNVPGTGEVTEPPTTRTTSTTQRPTTTRVHVTFVGDDETVDHHKTHDDKHGIPTSPSVPQICDGNYDTVAMLRGELFVFRNEFLWRLSTRGEIQDGYPVPFRQMFRKLPETVTKIDAAYERERDGNIVLFSGNQFWVYDGTDFIDGSPRPLTDYGLPQHLNQLDAVQVWKKNGKVFLYSGDQYWRFNETAQKMDPGYPHNISRWKGVPSNLDAAMTWKDGLTYFFKGKLFWRFDNVKIKTDDRYPLPAPQYWLGCPEKPDTIWW